MERNLVFLAAVENVHKVNDVIIFEELSYTTRKEHETTCTFTKPILKRNMGIPCFVFTLLVDWVSTRPLRLSSMRGYCVTRYPHKLSQMLNVWYIYLHLPLV